MIIRHSLLPALAATLLGHAPLHAETPAPAPAAAPAKVEAKAEEKVEPYQLKNRSTFTVPSESTHAPFWPIGWVPRKGGSAVANANQSAQPKVALDEKFFRVTSILLGTGTTGSLAVINGRAYGEGEFIKMPRAIAAVSAVTGRPAAPATRIRVQRITDGTVVLQREEQVITLTLLRPELAQRKSEEVPLEDER